MATTTSNPLVTCPHCHGSSRFYSQAGRNVGPCFRCGGTGKLEGKTLVLTRQEQHNRAVERARRARAFELADKIRYWRACNHRRNAWIEENARHNTFASSLENHLQRFGSLTLRQLAAIDRIINERK